MGCDGGTIPRRDELVRTKQKPEQKDKTADLAAKWKHCAITQDQLREPVMACELGRLYNKESALEFLIDRTKFECAPSFEHLRGLKDLKQLNLTENRNYSNSKSEKGDAYIDTQDAKYICPVVGLEMNGMHKFSYLWSCGCVLSERALKEVKGDTCHKCGKVFTENDIIPLNGSDDELDALHTRMEERRLQQKLDKKAKKSKKQKCETATSSSAADAESGPSSSKKAKLDATDSKLTNGFNGDSKLTNGNKGDSKLTNGSKGSKFTAEDSKQKLTNGSTVRNLNDKMDLHKPGSIQKDPKASTAYKSLFTSSDKAKNQMKGHWVTSNPYWM
ncbi:replication termination factor 2-like [Mercenaria mercenaria]|uniref:replication termination factor 2-like n=1 Tax=Mercenaria mercenaria TaxID=6596 RepID=UPI00234F86E0|nr:replication termination factor 2-like [Mercenaria mercenaria]